MKTPALMVLGTGSHVGKSLLTAALCRIFADAGVRVAPFKAQNMSLNSAATVEDLEIGRAQALQAEAARVPASVHMNPVLLKPTGQMTSQIVVRGRIWGRLSAAAYHQRRVQELFPLVTESYDLLAAQYELIVLEGAGSPAEINLKQNDIVNMRMAAYAGAACVLVGDIDRGGVFASLLGTVELLDADERALICGFVINKFRGDVTLLEPGIRMIEERLGKPCLGVVPWLPGLALDEEDSLGLPAERHAWPDGSGVERALRVAVVTLPSFSNFTDFDSLAAEPSVALRFVGTLSQMQGADLIILPGSKQTADDLRWLRAQGLAEALERHAETGLLAGICGGMQMLGCSIFDPNAVEGEGEVKGLGLLPFDTTMLQEKITRQVSGRLAVDRLFGQPMAALPVSGYEIHVGATAYHADAAPFVLVGAAPDGCVASHGRVFGTYLHGIFDENDFRRGVLAAAREFHGLAPARSFTDWRARRELALNRLADCVRQSLDTAALLHMAGEAH